MRRIPPRPRFAAVEIGRLQRRSRPHMLQHLDRSLLHLFGLKVESGHAAVQIPPTGDIGECLHRLR